MTAPVLWKDLQVDGQPPVGLTEDQWDSNFAGLDARVRAFEDLQLGARGLGELSVVRDGQAVSIPLTDGSGADAHNLPLASFLPRGDWATGTAYVRGDLVTVGVRSAVATADHDAGVWADDLAAGLWAMNSSSVDALNPRGVFDPAAQYVVGDAVLYSPDGVRWGLWSGTVRDLKKDIPVGTAPGTVDGDGFPYWEAETVLPRGRQLTLRSRNGLSPGGGYSTSVRAGVVAARRLALPVSIPAGWAGSGGVVQPAPAAGASFEVHVDGVTVATLTIPPAGIEASLVGAGSLLIAAGSLVELVNVGPALSQSTMSVGIAGTHV